MADLGKVPGMRKNGEPMEVIEDIDALTDDELIEALNMETAAWNAQGLDPMQIQHDQNALDVQLMTIVQLIIEQNVLSEDDMNLRFRRNMLKKLRDLRSNITKAQITQGVAQKSRIIRP